MVTIRMLTMVLLVLVLMIPCVESWCTSTPLSSFTGLGLAPQHRQQQPLLQRRSTHNMNIRSNRPILTLRQAKQERRPTDDDDNVKGNKKGDANEESSGLLRSVGNVFSFSKSSSKNETAAGKGDKEKDSSNSTASWWPPLRRKSAPEAEEKIPEEAPVGGKRGSKARPSSSSVNSRRPSQIKVSPPPNADRGKEGIRRDKKGTTGRTKQEAKTVKDRKEADRRNVTSNENPSLANRFQSLLNTTMPWNQQQQQDEGASSNKTENPVSGFLKFIGSAATDSMQQLKNRSDSDWGPYLSNAQKSVFDAASGGMKRFTKSSSTEWLPIFPKTRISPGEVVPATVADIDLLVIASSDGSKLYCIANSCPHLGTPLETGMLQRRPIETSSKMSPLSTKILSSTKSTSTDTAGTDDSPSLLSELEVMRLLQQDGCEDCIVCPLHQTAFALESGQVRGEWCPYPPVIGKIMGTVNAANPAAVFDIRYKGKNVEVRLNTPTAQDTPSK
jgi:nitrite reductase/ring-hydroxylating ferredoxin subunit